MQLCDRNQQHSLLRFLGDVQHSSLGRLQEAEDALNSTQEASGPAGPAVRLSASRLVLTATVGTTTSATLTVRAVGTAAFRFYWTRSVQRPSAATPASSGGAAANTVSDPTDEQSGFYMYNASGSIMPGEERTFEFMWKPTGQGMATEVWQLHTSPQCVDGFEPPQVSFLATYIVLKGNFLTPSSALYLKYQLQDNQKILDRKFNGQVSLPSRWCYEELGSTTIVTASSGSVSNRVL